MRGKKMGGVITLADKTSLLLGADLAFKRNELF